MINIKFDSYNDKYKKPFGAVSKGTDVLIQIEIDEDCEVYLIVDNLSNIERYHMEKNDAMYSFNLDTSKYTSTIYYYFEIQYNDKIIYYANNHNLWGGVGSIYNETTNNLYQITIYDKKYPKPKWFMESSIYHIFVDRFYNNEIDLESLNYDLTSIFGGNLKGIMEKLDYIESLGCSTICLTPIFEADEYHKYHTKDYEKIDRGIGDEDIFTQLISEIKKRNMHIILDGVFNHCSINSKYFNKNNLYDTIGAYQSKDSFYYDWFLFNDYPDDYETYMDVKEIPKLNGKNKDLLDYFLRNDDAIIKKWMGFGIDGWRMDAANYMDGKYLEDFYKAIKSYNPDAIVVGEAWRDASNYEYYENNEHMGFYTGYKCDSMINYPVHGLIIEYVLGNFTCDIFKSKLYSLIENYPYRYLYSAMNFISNHDVGRALTAFDNNLDSLKLAFVLLFSLPGVPTVYYGDEVGLSGGWDHEARRPFPWSNMNNEILKHVKQLLKLRNTHDSIKKGKIEIIDYDKLLIIKRYYDNDEIIFALNNTDEDILFEYEHDLKSIISDNNKNISAHGFNIFIA